VTKTTYFHFMWKPPTNSPGCLLELLRLCAADALPPATWMQSKSR